MASLNRNFAIALLGLLVAFGGLTFGQPCTTATDCPADGNFCTASVCQQGTCVQEPIPDCDGICRGPGFWSTHAGAQANVTQLTMNSCTGCFRVCGEVVRDTELDSADSAIEALCIPSPAEPRLRLAQQLTTLALNCCISGFGSECGGDPERAALFEVCNTLCEEGDTHVDDCIEMLDCVNNGGVVSDPNDRGPVCRKGTCEDQPFCNEELNLCFEGWPANSAQECAEAKGPFNECTLLPPGESACATGTVEVQRESCCGDGVCEGSEDGGTCPVDCVCESSCIGEDACTGNTGIIGCNSCIGDRACFDNIGNVGDGSCIESKACANNGADVGDGSCKGSEACNANAGVVGASSCIGDYPCLGNRGAVATDSCLGQAACSNNNGDVGPSSCQGNSACDTNDGNIGTGSCKGFEACLDNVNSVGNGSCNAGHACCANVLPRADGVCNLDCECADASCASCPLAKSDRPVK